MKHRILVALFFITSGTLVAQAQDKSVVLILDGSNSIWVRMDGVEKIVVARGALGLHERPGNTPKLGRPSRFRRWMNQASMKPVM